MKTPRGAALITLLLGTVLLSSTIYPDSSEYVIKTAVNQSISKPDNRWVEKTLKRMSLRDKIAQLIQVRLRGRFMNRLSPQFREIERDIRRNHLGGVVLFAGNVYESALLLNELQDMSQVPLLVSADFERGAAFRIADATSFPWTMAVGATQSEDFAYRQGAVTARESRAIGVHWILAPVLDVNNNPSNPVINIRSYGEDPELVARLGAAFIRGARDHGVLTTAKHFPGHGDTSTDSHIGLPVIKSDQARMNSVELVPFRRALEAGVDAVMTAHIAMPQLTGEPELPATLSHEILTGLLRESLDFDGLIVTDAMEMGGIIDRYWTGLASVKALQAGADMLLLPPETDVAIDAVLRAVERGDLTEDRIDRSVERVLAMKTKLRLHKERKVRIDLIDKSVGSPESRSLGQKIADQSMTLLRDDSKLLPLNPARPNKLLSIVLASDLATSPGSVFQSRMRRYYPAVVREAVDTRLTEERLAEIEKKAAAADTIVCSTWVRVISGKGEIDLNKSQRRVLEMLLASGKPIVWIAFGNPYVLRQFPQVTTYLCTFSYSDVSQVAAAKALAGAIPIRGRMPISIPGICGVGDGLIRTKLEMTLERRGPADVGLDADAFAETEKLLNSHVVDRAFPGAALLVGYRGAIVLDIGAGRFEYSQDSPKVDGDTIFDLASLSKAIGTTSAAMMLAESGELLLDAAVQDYIPEFRGAGKDRVRVEHLLTHSSGLPAWLPLYKEAEGYEAFLGKVVNLPLEYEPGSRKVYSDFGMILMGEIVARAAARPLDQFLSEQLFGPLGLGATAYKPSRKLLDRIPPTEDDPWRGRVVRGEVHDENAFALGGVAGHAGLFSSTRDLAVLAQMLLNGGIYDHKRYLKPETISQFTRSRGSPGWAQGLGWRKPSPSSWSGRLFSRTAIGHTGFTGTSIWIDPSRELFLILLSNRVHPSRDNQKIEGVRQAISEAVVRAVDAASRDQ